MHLSKREQISPDIQNFNYIDNCDDYVTQF